MKITLTAIPDVKIIEPKVFEDQRGFFLEVYQQERYLASGIAADFIQDNYSGSRRGVLRGIHYQIHNPQGKLVWVLQGEVYDVAVDLRKNSPTFGKYVGIELSADNRRQLWVPPGFGHGFLVLSEWAEFMYKVTDRYNPEAERTIVWNDPDLAIAWPALPGGEVIVSPKDDAGVRFKEAEIYDQLP
jgi:dTDP-4-dehydrorhamnose 3,5-epimerase